MKTIKVKQPEYVEKEVTDIQFRKLSIEPQKSRIRAKIDVYYGPATYDYEIKSVSLTKEEYDSFMQTDNGEVLSRLLDHFQKRIEKSHVEKD